MTAEANSEEAQAELKVMKPEGKLEDANTEIRTALGSESSTHTWKSILRDWLLRRRRRTRTL